MRSGLIAAIATATLVAAAGQASAQVGGEPPAGEQGQEGSEQSGAEATQELGARLGLAAGGRTTPGGFYLAGSYLYRLTDADWLDHTVGFSFGGRGAACFRSRDDELLCDHGMFDGFALEAAVGVRHYFETDDRFQPFVRGGVVLRGVFYTGDDLSGFAVPLWLGGGIRARVAERISVIGEASLRTGFGIFGRDLGLEPQADLSIAAGAEFVID